MLRRIFALSIVLVLIFVVGAIALADEGNPAVDTVVYVASQGLFYDSIVLGDLPPHGQFQKLEPEGGPHGGPQTDFGPGDVGYLGGRWWVDANGNNEMDEGDVFFLCPLVGPGRSQP
jgi:hypothetical protein